MHHHFPLTDYTRQALLLERIGLWVMPAWSLLHWLGLWLIHPVQQQSWFAGVGLVALFATVVVLLAWQQKLYRRAHRAWHTADGRPSRAKRVFQDCAILWMAIAVVCYLATRESIWLLYMCWPLLTWSWLFGWQSLVSWFALTTGIIVMLTTVFNANAISLVSIVPGIGLIGSATLALYRLQVWISRQENMLEHLQSLASTDGLTGLINRREFNQRLVAEMARSRRHSSALSLAIFDIDHFKHINDQFGHPVGDRILRELGQMILQNIREHDIAARYGGEEFALILPETPIDAAVELMERLRALMARTVFCLPDQPLGLTISIGVGFFEPDDDVMFSLVERADVALYAAKNNGRNQVVYGVEPVHKQLAP
jgi:diguanylate cyclase (GGDEF)-like protein